MYNENNFKNFLIKNQKAATSLFIIALLISLYLLNQRDQNNLSSNKGLSIFNKSLIIFVYFYYLYISYNAYQKSKSKSDNIALISSVLSAIPPIIMLILYLVSENDPNKLNPQL